MMRFVSWGEEGPGPKYAEGAQTLIDTPLLSTRKHLVTTSSRELSRLTIRYSVSLPPPLISALYAASGPCGSSGK